MEAQKVYRMGRYVVDLKDRRVSCDGSSVELGWRHFEALKLLVEAGGGVVGKEEFFQTIWRGQLVDESNLTKCIAQLRKSLNNGGAEDHVETIPRIGYRLTVHAVPDWVVAEPDRIPSKSRGRRRIWAAAALLAITAGVGWAVAAKIRNRSAAEAIHEEGRRFRRQRDPNSIGSAIASFRAAINLNPGKATYYTSLAEALTQVPISPALDDRLMLETAQRGVALDARCGSCNAVLGFILFSRFWDWKGAERHLQAALELNPKDSGARGYHAMLLGSQGRLTEALQEVDAGIKLDPYHAVLHGIRGVVLYLSKRYPEADAAVSRALSFGIPQGSTWNWRAYCRLIQGDPAGAVAMVAESGIEYYPRDVGVEFRQRGLDGVVKRILAATDRPLPKSRYARAHWRMAVGDRAGALDELEAAQQARVFDVMYAGVDPMFEPLHDEPRFRKIITAMNLTELPLARP